jgi:hypothetical protein
MSAGHHKAPRSGSAAHIALRVLHALEGQASDERWRIAAAKSLGTKANRAHWAAIVQSLLTTSMVFQRRGVFIVSDEGLVWLGVPAEVVPRAEPQDAPERHVPSRSLSAKHLINVRSMREGAFDYRGIPSLHGDVRVAFKSSLSVVSADRK